MFYVLGFIYLFITAKKKTFCHAYHSVYTQVYICVMHFFIIDKLMTMTWKCFFFSFLFKKEEFHVCVFSCSLYDILIIISLLAK